MPYHHEAPAGHRLRGLELDLYVNPVGDGPERLSQGHNCVYVVDVVDEHRNAGGRPGRTAYIRRPETRLRMFTADAVHDLAEGDGHGDLAVALVHRTGQDFQRMPWIMIPWRLVEGEPHIADRIGAGPVVVPVPIEAGSPFGGRTFRLFDFPLFGEPTWKPVTDPA